MGRTCCSDHAAHMRRWRAENPEANARAVKPARRRYEHRNPEKKKAWGAVYRATQKGVLVRPDTCERCSRVGRVEASHNDYDKPLEVEWLCRQCHRSKDGLQ